jgi:hypothetical protein
MRTEIVYETGGFAAKETDSPQIKKHLPRRHRDTEKSQSNSQSQNQNLNTEDTKKTSENAEG